MKMKVGDKFIAKEFDKSFFISETMDKYVGLECEVYNIYSNEDVVVKFKDGNQFFWDEAALKPIEL